MDSPQLPEVLPVFPLTGSLLLPGSYLPLNVFEPRYRHMVRDATAGEERWIGMVQPLVPQQDNAPPPEALVENPELYEIGCAGWIERCEPQPDGRYLILLKGVSRFRTHRELPLVRGYRRVVADFSEFAADLEEPEAPIDPAPILRALRAFAREHGLEMDLEMLGALPGVTLLNGLSVALPFRPAEKQALLEAPGPAEREELLVALMSMGIETRPGDDYYAPPILN